MQSMISVQGLIFEYATRRIFDGLSFNIEPGSVTALVGPNGAGKTTLLRCIAGLLPIFSGKIAVNGVDVSEDPRRVHRGLGYLSDFFGLYEDLSVYHCLQYHAKIQQVSSSDIEDKIYIALKRVGLEKCINQCAGELSRGLRQRLAIAQAIIHEPTLILLDEPASGLDPVARDELSKLIIELNQQGATLVVSSHIISELEEYCDHMLFLEGGRLVTHVNARDRDTAKITLIVELGDTAERYREIIESYTKASAIKMSGNVFEVQLGDADDKQGFLAFLVTAGVPVQGMKEKGRHFKDIYMEHSKSSGGDNA